MTTPQQAPHLAAGILAKLRIGAKAEEIAAALVEIAEQHPPRVAVGVALRVGARLPHAVASLFDGPDVDQVLRIVEAGTR